MLFGINHFSETENAVGISQLSLLSRSIRLRGSSTLLLAGTTLAVAFQITVISTELGRF